MVIPFCPGMYLKIAPTKLKRTQIYISAIIVTLTGTDGGTFRIGLTSVGKRKSLHIGVDHWLIILSIGEEMKTILLVLLLNFLTDPNSYAVAQDNGNKLGMRINGTLTQSLGEDSLTIRVVIFNYSDSAVVLYNFTQDWTVAGPERVHFSSFLPWLGHWIWDPGINVSLVAQSDSIPLGLGRIENLYHLDTSAIVQSRTIAVNNLRKTRTILNARDSLWLELEIVLKEGSLLPKGQYSLIVYYEMNRGILSYVPLETNMFMGRLKSNKMAFIIK